MPNAERAARDVPEAIVFDFDGVIVNSEPLHLRATQEALAARGLRMSEEQYYARYVGFDARSALDAKRLNSRGRNERRRRIRRDGRRPFRSPFCTGQGGGQC